MSKTPHSDLFALSAASGWLDLGNAEEAMAELNRVSPEIRNSPEALSVEWEIHQATHRWENAVAVARRLAETAPDQAEGWVKQAYALHEMKRTQEAWDCLFPASQKFIEETIIPYNLACYACQLGRKEEALKWLRRAFCLDEKKQFRQMALEDPDLEPLREQIRKLGRKRV